MSEEGAWSPESEARGLGSQLLDLGGRGRMSHGLLHPKESIGIWTSGSLKAQEAVVGTLNPEGKGG